MHIGYADDSTLMTVVPLPGVGVAVAEYLNLDLSKVSERCDLCRMKLNPSKTTKVVSRSHTIPSLPLTIGRTEPNEFDDLDLLGVTFDSKITFEKHLCSVSRATSQTLCILLERCYQGFILTVLQCGVRLPIHALYLDTWSGL